MAPLFNDTTMKAVQFALTGVNQRQQATAHNIANVNTPGFRSSRVNFEDSLADALRTGRSLDDVTWSTERANTPINARGNDVALEEESQILIQAGIHYEALVAGLNHKLGVVRTAIGGGR